CIATQAAQIGKVGVGCEAAAHELHISTVHRIGVSVDNALDRDLVDLVLSKSVLLDIAFGCHRSHLSSLVKIYSPTTCWRSSARAPSDPRCEIARPSARRPPSQGLQMIAMQPPVSRS